MKKILVIEDEPNIRELILYNLKTNGYEAVAAEDGIMGITMVHREKPDLILLDIMLPEKNGYEICTDGIQSIPSFWENGIKYFKIKSPTGEEIEFCHIL